LGGCDSVRNAQVANDRILAEIKHGDLILALDDVNRASQKYGKLSQEWDWRFRILRAQVLVSRSEPKEALALLMSDFPPSLMATDIAVRRLIFEATAYRYLQQSKEAEQKLAEAEQLANSLHSKYLCHVIVAKASLLFYQEQYAAAEENELRAIALARQYGLPEQEANAQAGRAIISGRQDHLDEAVERNQQALALARSQQMGALEATVLGNLGWAYFELGDFENALQFYLQGAEGSRRRGLNGNYAFWYGEVANSYFALHRYAEAEESARRSLEQAKSVGDVETIRASLNSLAEVSLRTGKLDDAAKYNQEALQIEQKELDNFGIRESTLVSARIATGKRHFVEAENLLRQLGQDPNLEAANRWQLHARLAELYDAEDKPSLADQQYRKSIDSIKAARDSIDRDDSRLTYLSSGIEFYDDYVSFLVRRKRPNDALHVAELSRARMLLEGLSVDPKASARPIPEPQPQQIAKRFQSTLLFYWVGDTNSYLWAITPLKTECFLLPKAAELEPLIRSYSKAVRELRDPQDAGSKKGQQLYSLLIAPAKNLLPKDGRIILLPDPSLSALNFEALIVPGPAPHFWIDDVTLTNASSLTLLSASAVRLPSRDRSLLLVGNTEPVETFPALAKAPEEMQRVESYFPAAKRAVLEGKQATPQAFLLSHPERFAYLHFVTHGTASITRPLDSAVILSKSGDTYKLYARDIIQHRLSAELVTISACEGAAGRAYSGEGLVGLSWAFLRAGAHNVVGALWEVNDSAAPQIMDAFYSEMNKGKDPASALRAAKLALLHNHDPDIVFRKPFYWAPFQLYAGS
jgi:CHAT domain-containing protein